MINRAHFHKNRLCGSMFSEKRRRWRHAPKNDVIPSLKMSESFGNFFREIMCSKLPIMLIFTKIGSVEVCFPKNVGDDVMHQKWRHTVIKNVGIVWKLFSRNYTIKMTNRANFHKNRLCGSMFSKNVGYDAMPPKRWRHTVVKDVGIVWKLFSPTYIVNMNNRGIFYINRICGSMFYKKSSYMTLCPQKWRHAVVKMSEPVW